MKSLTFVSLAFYALCSSQIVASASTIESDTTICKTQYGTGKSVPTQQGTIWKSYNSHTTTTTTLTSTPVTKVTAAAKTSTFTETAQEIVTRTKSAPNNGCTVTSTITDLETITAPASTVLTTVTTTTTVSVTTTSGYSEAGIVPVFATLRNARQKRSRIYGRQTSKNPAVILSSSQDLSGPVTCSVINYQVVVVEVTKKAPAQTVTITPAAVHKTVTSTHTGTSVIFSPRPKSIATSFTTITSFTTTTPVVTSTSTSTVTSTVTATETVYPQCGSNNFARSVLDVPIYSGRQVDGGNVLINDAPDSTQCCINCLRDPTCAAFLFGLGAVGEGKCVYYVPASGVCDPANPIKLAAYTDASLPANGATGIGNGKCGQFDRVAVPPQ